MTENPYAYMKTNYEKQQKAVDVPKPSTPAMEYVPIPDVGERYRLLKDGRIASLSYLKPYVNKKGFLSVNIRDDEGKQHTYLLHMLVARVHVRNPLGKRRVTFKDGNKLNCAADNLEWV